MVYFKITKKIKQAMDDAGVAPGFIGCGALCDKQLVSAEQLDLLMTVYNSKHAETKLTLQDLIEDQQPLMIPEHFCNTNLKGTTTKASDIIAQTPKKYKLPTISDEEMKKEQEMCERTLAKRKAKKEKRDYKRLIGGTAGGSAKKSYANEIKEIHSSLAYSASFLMAFVLSFFGGYFFSKYIMGYDNVMAMMVGIAVTVTTLFTEGFLYIISENRRIAKNKEEIKFKMQ